MVGGTTWSLNASGKPQLFADGTPTRVSDAIITPGTQTATAGTSGVVPAASSSGAVVGGGERMTGGAGRKVEGAGLAGGVLAFGVAVGVELLV